jgi:hypothetical protein
VIEREVKCVISNKIPGFAGYFFACYILPDGEAQTTGIKKPNHNCLCSVDLS